MFENPNLIPKILRRHENQESSASSRPLYRSISCPVKWIYLEDEPFDKQFETSLFVNFSEYELSNLVPDLVFLEDLQFEFITSHLDKHFRNSIQSEITSEGTSNISVITSASPSS